MQMLQYRQGGLADLSGLVSLAIAAYSEFSPQLTSENQTVLNHAIRSEESMVKLIKMSTPFVCTAGGELVGMAFIVPSGNPTVIFDHAWAYIRMVGVNPQYRGSGIARYLTQMCIDYARSTGEHTIALHTSELMDAARHIYAALGFKVLREIDPIFGKRYWLYTMPL